jgi:hypothetical protein
VQSECYLGPWVAKAAASHICGGQVSGPSGFPRERGGVIDGIPNTRPTGAGSRSIHRSTVRRKSWPNSGWRDGNRASSTGNRKKERNLDQKATSSAGVTATADFIHWTSGRRNTIFREGRDGYAGLNPRRLGVGQGVVRREETGAGPSGGASPRTRDACRNDKIQPGRMGD